MKSALDTHQYQPGDYKKTGLETPEKPQLNLNCKPAKATKFRDLSSDIFAVGQNLQKHFEADNDKNVIVDLALKGLPQTANEDQLKKIAQVKHVISAAVDHDSITNQCVGTGRVKLRLSANEDLDMVKLQYLKAGFAVQEYEGDAKKKA